MANLSDIPPHLIKQAELLTGRSGVDSVSHILSTYPDLINELRTLRRRFSDFDRESLELDFLESELKKIAILINKL